MEGHTLLPLLSLLSFPLSSVNSFSHGCSAFITIIMGRAGGAPISLSLPLFPAAMFEVMISSGAIQ